MSRMNDSERNVSHFQSQITFMVTSFSYFFFFVHLLSTLFFILYFLFLRAVGSEHGEGTETE
jgi:hypothetical protein